MPVINFSGLASGIDSEALIETTSKVQRQIKIKPRQDKISAFEETNSALTELKTKLTSLQSILRGFSSLGGGIVSKQAISSDESVLTAAANSSARAGSYNISVSQLAKNGTATLSSTASTYTSQDSVIAGGLGAPAPVQIQVGTGSELETITIQISNTTTLNQFVSEFNTSPSNTKAVATLINIGTSSNPDYQVMISSKSQGLEKGTVAITVDPTIVAQGAFNDNSLSQATNALFTMDGVGGTITRASNTISDLIDGVTFSLAGSGSSTVTVSNDQTATLSAVKEFIEKYNEIVTFVAENNTVTREEDGENVTNIFGPLAKTRVDDGILANLRTDISSTSTTSETITIIAAMGIETDRDGTLKFKEDVFKAAFDSEPEAISDLFTKFSDRAALTDGTIHQYIRFNGLIDTTTNGNKSQVTNLNDQIARAEQILGQQEAQMRARFARLEALIGRLQNQQQSLASLFQSGQ